MRVFLMTLAGASVMALSVAYGATQGTLGTTSTGTVDISAEKLAGVRISGLDDIVFGSTVTAPAAQADALCVYSTPGAYTIRATSANATGTTFRLSGGGTNYMTYTVAWYDAASGGTSTALGSGQTSTAIANGDQAAQDCGGSNNARVEVTVNAASFAAAATGTYSDTLTLMVAPQ
jgi:hypothetical protein